jgi:CBS domain-containing protein
VAVLQERHVGSLPVVAEGRFLGLVSERDLIPVIASLDGHKGPGGNTVGAGPLCQPSAETEPLPLAGIHELVRPAPTTTDSASLEEVLALFERYQELDVLPVVSLEGRYCGAVMRSDLLESLYDRLRPPVVGGMATPLGVYLTTGSMRGGVGDGALFLTGLMMAGLFGLAYGVLFLVGWLVDILRGSSFHFLLVSSEFLLLQETGEKELMLPLTWLWLTLAMIPGTMLLLMRLSSLAGYHAGEHQVVHALEKGLPLRPEWVRAQPRAHPRCGTNLVVIIYTALTSGTLLYAGVPWWYVLPPAIAMRWLWRRVGMVLQTFLTTRPATPRQIEAGIRAATEIVSRYQAHPDYRARLWKRFWNRGLLQTLAGLGSGSGLLYLGYHYVLQGLLAVLF